MTAVFNGDTRVIGHYRSQWNTVPVNYLTFSGAADTKLFNPKMKNSLFGIGVIFNHDEAGYSKLKNSQFGLTGAYTHQLNEKHFLTLGIQGTISQRRFDYTDLTWDNQYGPNPNEYGADSYLASLPSREPNENTTGSYGSFSMGLNYHIQNRTLKTLHNPHHSQRSKLDVGLALYNINRPLTGFWDDERVELPMGIKLYAIGTIGVAKRIDIVPRFYASFQMPHTELVPSLNVRFHLNTTPTKETALQVGLAYRFADEGDAIAPIVEFFRQRWRVGLSYDINISDFDAKTRGLGGPEMSIQYIITKVRIGEFKICPIF